MLNKYEQFMQESRKEQKTLKFKNLASYALLLFLFIPVFINLSEYFNRPPITMGLFMILSSIGICVAYTFTLLSFTRFKKRFDQNQKDMITEIINDTRKTQEYDILNKVMYEQPLKTCWIIAQTFNKSLIDFNKISHKKSEWVVDFTKATNYSFEDLSKPEVSWQLTNAFLKEALKSEKESKIG